MTEQSKTRGREIEIEFPYSSATGPAVSKVLTAFRDDEQIWGLKCPKCNRVVAPAQDYCEICAEDMSEWIEVGPEGKIVTWTVVRRDHVLYPHKAPFAYALIQLDGADTALLHTVLAQDYSTLSEGARVKAVWKEERTGNIRDLDYFALVEEA